jgi:DNA-binding response OmpR family regulator
MPKKILVVDDEVYIAKIVKFTLEHENFEVLVAHDGKEGLRLAREEKPDLIILDLMLPNIDGYRICRLLKFDEKYRHIPVILLSARTTKQDMELGNQVGANAFMKKPFDPEALVAKIKELLGTSVDATSQT